jgi:hypothetical protein
MTWSETIRTLWLRVQIGIKEDSVNYRLLDTLFFTYINCLCISWKSFLLNLSYFAQSEDVWRLSVTNTRSETWPSHYVLKEKKRKGELAILLNFKNNVLPRSEVTRVAGEQYPVREHLFKSERKLRSMVLSEGSKENKRNETSSAKCLKRNLVGSQSESGVGVRHTRTEVRQRERTRLDK